MYKSISPNLNFVEEEKKVEKFWEDENIFEKSIAEREAISPMCSMTARLPQTASRI